MKFYTKFKILLNYKRELNQIGQFRFKLKLQISKPDLVLFSVASQLD